MRGILILFILLVVSAPVMSDTLTGRVLRVNDGDFLVVLGAGNAQYGIRLSGIIAPEIGQPYGQNSMTNLSDLVTGKYVVVDYARRDRYGRIVGKVLLNGQDMNLEQIKAGLAWHNKETMNEQLAKDWALYAAAEDEAKAAKRGLWNDPNPVPPQEWQREK